MVLPRKKKLGELLVNEGLLNPTQLSQALEEQKRSGDRLGKVLARLAHVSEEDIIQVLGRQLGIRSVNFESFLIDPQLLKTVPESVARRYQAIPVYDEDGELVVAMVDPLNVFAIDDLARESGRRIRSAVAKEDDILKAIDQNYGGELSVEAVMDSVDLLSLGALPEGEGSREKLEEVAGETPVVKLVNTLLLQAVSDKASDLHLEPDEDNLKMRLRIDGVLHQVATLPKTLQPAILSRLKILANIDIAEKRQAQDGRFQFRVGNQEVDVRAATLPTIHGEKIALRLLDKSCAVPALTALGMVPNDLTLFEGLFERPHGMILITGPTGSGKTTTLYAVLQNLDAVRKNIVTIEEPVEYQLKNVTQVQVNRRLGVNFANGLRSILRQDPDIIMVGEIRDRETAEIAIHAALTGHLVFSTLHTNDAAGAAARLLEMGIEPFLVASSLEGIVGQRLVRLICPDCRVSFRPEAEVLAGLGLPPGAELFRGESCSKCKGTGYQGRTGIFETLILNDELRAAIVSKSSADVLRGLARKFGYQPLREEGLQKVREGKTTIEEVLRVTIESER